jgi:hypothetical protein
MKSPISSTSANNPATIIVGATPLGIRIHSVANKVVSTASASSFGIEHRGRWSNTWRDQKKWPTSGPIFASEQVHVTSSR